MWVDGQGQLPIPTPQALSAKEIERLIEDYVRSAELSIEAGFDGVELHGANGYLIEQFLNTAANQRTDGWGGSVDNRVRFAVEIAKRAAAKIGADRLGIRVSPYSAAGGLRPDDEQVEDVHEQLASELKKIGFVYMHIVDHSSLGGPTVPDSVKNKIRTAFGGTVILSGGYDRARAEADLAAGRGDLVAFGRPFIANPRLPSCLRDNLPLAQPDPNTFYTPDEKGYTDYPIVP